MYSEEQKSNNFGTFTFFADEQIIFTILYIQQMIQCGRKNTLTNLLNSMLLIMHTNRTTEEKNLNFIPIQLSSLLQVIPALSKRGQVIFIEGAKLKEIRLELPHLNESVTRVN